MVKYTIGVRVRDKNRVKVRFRVRVCLISDIRPSPSIVLTIQVLLGNWILTSLFMSLWFATSL